MNWVNEDADIDGAERVALDKGNYRAIRRHVAESCGSMAELVVGEVLANAVEHGTDPEVAVSVHPTRVSVLVTNQVRRDDRPKARGTGGRGLLIVNNLIQCGAVLKYDCFRENSHYTTRLVLSREHMDICLLPSDDLYGRDF